MKHFAMKIHGEFTNIYEWGRPWNKEKHTKWLEYWNNVFPKKKKDDPLKSMHWHFSPHDQDAGCTGYLSTFGCSIFLHPLHLSAILVASAGCLIEIMDTDGEMRSNHFENEITELNEILNECAAYCGGTFSLSVTPEFLIDVPEDYELIELSMIDNYPKTIVLKRGTYER